MTFPNLKNNIEEALKKNHYSISQLEKKAGLKKNNIYNILKGIIQNPSANNIQAIADALEMSVEDLLSNKSNSVFTNKITKKEETLIIQISEKIFQLSNEGDIYLSINEFCTLLKKVFEYSNAFNLEQVDEKFLKWTLEQNYKK